MCEARPAQSVERKTLNLVVVGSSPTVGDCFTLSLDFYFTILFFFECIASPNIRQESLLKRSMGLQQQPAYAPQADIGTYPDGSVSQIPTHKSDARPQCLVIMQTSTLYQADGSPRRRCSLVCSFERADTRMRTEQQQRFLWFPIQRTD